MFRQNADSHATRDTSHNKSNYAGKLTITEMFCACSREAMEILEIWPEIVEEIWPLKKKHRDKLPSDISSLSRKLTSERSVLELNYWSRPENVSAYLYYFMPWNLIRLLKVIPALPLQEPVILEGGEEPVLIDAGSGPLTFPIALWLAKSSWREKPIHFFAQDKISRPLQIGRELLNHLIQRTGKNSWQIHTSTGSLFNLADGASTILANGKTYPCLLSAINVLNELKPLSNWKNKNYMDFQTLIEAIEEGGHKLSGEQVELYALLYSWSSLLGKNRHKKMNMLFVEPGNRRGGSFLMHMRKAAQSFHLKTIFPCTSSAECPLFAMPGESSSFYQKKWCHFITADFQVPKWLADLSKASGLTKTSLSLSLLMLAQNEKPNADTNKGTRCRIISQGFRVPGKPGKCCYGCSARGLLMLENCAEISSGSELETGDQGETVRDKKSGAFCVKLS